MSGQLVKISSFICTLLKYYSVFHHLCLACVSRVSVFTCHAKIQGTCQLSTLHKHVISFSPGSESSQRSTSGSEPWPVAPSCVHQGQDRQPPESPAQPLWS